MVYCLWLTKYMQAVYRSLFTVILYILLSSSPPPILLPSILYMFIKEPLVKRYGRIFIKLISCMVKLVLFMVSDRKRVLLISWKSLLFWGCFRHLRLKLRQRSCRRWCKVDKPVFNKASSYDKYSLLKIIFKAVDWIFSMAFDWACVIPLCHATLQYSIYPLMKSLYRSSRSLLLTPAPLSTFSSCHRIS